jgi:hypothetical protein
MRAATMQTASMRVVLVAIAVSTTAFLGPAHGAGKQRVQEGPASTQQAAKGVKTASTPLTPQECAGLGGQVRPSLTLGCPLICATVDQHGVVRAACINELAPN